MYRKPALAISSKCPFWHLWNTFLKVLSSDWTLNSMTMSGNVQRKWFRKPQPPAPPACPSAVPGFVWEQGRPSRPGHPPKPALTAPKIWSNGIFLTWSACCGAHPLFPECSTQQWLVPIPYFRVAHVSEADTPLGISSFSSAGKHHSRIRSGLLSPVCKE